MTPSDLAALERLEADAERARGHFPKLAAGVAWLGQLVRRMDAPESVQDDRDKVLVQQAERIRVLESRLGLTPERVLAEERKELRVKQERVVEKAMKARGEPRRKGSTHTPSVSELRKSRGKPKK